MFRIPKQEIAAVQQFMVKENPDSGNDRCKEQYIGSNRFYLFILYHKNLIPERISDQHSTGERSGKQDYNQASAGGQKRPSF